MKPWQFAEEIRLDMKKEVKNLVILFIWIPGDYAKEFI